MRPIATARVVEIFSSLQGEGPLAGRATTFVRMAGCNFKCDWCDTAYAQQGGEDMTISDIVFKLRNLAPRHVTFTGGEPMLQDKQIRAIILKLPNWYRFGVETNGTVGRTIMSDRTRITYVVSPKLSNAGRRSPFDEAWVNMQEWGTAEIWFKFVVANEADTKEVSQFVAAHDIDPESVWIMPMCITAEEHLRLWPDVFKAAVEYGFNASPRLHVLAFGNKRGV